MEFFEVFPAALLLVAVALGLVVGSFLNVVAYRLPIMMERAWREQCAELQAEEFTGPPHGEGRTFNLWTPRSACPDCGTPVSALHNVPVLSFVLLRGRCAHCQGRISMRYPAIEIATALLSLVVAWRLGPTWQTAVALPFTWTLVALAVIDIDRKLLPDSLTLPLLWAGLLVSLFSVDGAVLFTDLRSSVIGAVTGYLSLWSVYQLFRLITGKEGMGYGDFKLLAALGAWLGWQVLPLIILLSATCGALLGVAAIVIGGRSRHVPIPFGPYLAAAGWIAVLWGEQLMGLYDQLLR